MLTNNTIKELENVLKTLGNLLQEATNANEYRKIGNQFGAVQNAMTILRMVDNATQLAEDFKPQEIK